MAQLIPARYIGDYPVHLSSEHGKRHGARLAEGHTTYDHRIDGKVISKGDIVLMPAEDVLGQTFWHDPAHNQPSLRIGVGHVIMPQHAVNPVANAPYSREELQALGYEFHMGRPDFEPVVPDGEAPAANNARIGKNSGSKASATAATTQPAPAAEQPQEMPDAYVSGYFADVEPAAVVDAPATAASDTATDTANTAAASDDGAATVKE